MKFFDKLKEKTSNFIRSGFEDLENRFEKYLPEELIEVIPKKAKKEEKENLENFTDLFVNQSKKFMKRKLKETLTVIEEYLEPEQAPEKAPDLKPYPEEPETKPLTEKEEKGYLVINVEGLNLSEIKNLILEKIPPDKTEVLIGAFMKIKSSYGDYDTWIALTPRIPANLVNDEIDFRIEAYNVDYNILEYDIKSISLKFFGDTEIVGTFKDLKVKEFKAPNFKDPDLEFDPDDVPF